MERYAAKMGYPRLDNIALPYMGALTTVLDTLTGKQILVT